MSEPAPMYLVSVAGPPVGPFVLDSTKTTALRIGRNEQCEILLPVREDRVSRFHARLDFDGSRWRLTDLNSRWGTHVNGCRINANQDLPLGEGDLVRISPWTFSFSAAAARQDSVQPDDGMPTLVRNVPDARLVDEQLDVLLESMAAIHGAADEKSLADLLIDAALRGTGMTNAAVLRPVDNAGRVQIVAANKPGASAVEDHPRYSRSLLNAASTGQVAELQTGAGDIAQSIMMMNISAALCVPIIIGARSEAGGTIAAYLYIDSRGSGSPRPRPNAAQFCVALGRMAGLALANLKRMEIEIRQAMLESELSAAATTQRWILPVRSQRFEAIECVGESRPGRYVGGDFFDIIDLGDARIAVTLGDVTGKGVSAGVLMTATQGYLHACLREHGDVLRAVTAVNRFVALRTPDERFVTAWVGVLNLRDKTIHYIDAGHGYAMLQPHGEEPIDLRGGDGLPIGVDVDFSYRAVTRPLPDSGRLLIVSDGLVEQCGIVQSATGGLVQDQFDLPRLQAALMASPEGADTVADLFAAVVNHAGTTQLADDATAVLVKW